MKEAIGNVQPGSRTDQQLEEMQRSLPVLASEQLSAAAHPWPTRLVIFAGIFCGLQFADIHITSLLSRVRAPWLNCRL